ncbi:aminomethyl-transferring glycine dehydrogenase subunit GcvPA [Paenibacillus sp. CGMCC 1.16610]|uniref:Probable glycine dehydrogenase (decarboxylating) subunit 1 n=1 Tax=Paenibacillus anseongense TaxID=2682845 RepID=A0ABW9U6Y0_9BACL|nr:MULTISPECIES: aminomethyl-transferring glycine dehydrogenase subunit GcvPA [Paenibacillus]MBA2941910.1 aminomethyl-transferring glycine dehydrogenase subunit GcvPA [Paenibacillus sp. CGMCC 1.16610]MVQ35852.1 aminomethyl-transferring glycine dehydrogenase subunit GcvPA [Paenibacillus anseongense]
MKHRYLPITEQDQKDMLATIGISSMEEMFQDIPQKVRFQGELNVSKALDEQGLLRYMRGLSSRNADFDRYASFLGAGIYDHHLPVVINHVISRSEFYTAYTPYQPEISQGELQAIFEFQSYICELTGMAVANASMYDGATALAEAGALASGATKRSRLLVSRAVHPEARAILRTTARGLNLEVVEIGLTPEGVTDLHDLASKAEGAAAVILQSPNFFGCMEDIGAAEPIAHGAGALLVVSANPLTLGLLEAPGKLGADIVVGDCQPLGIPAALGGPTCGYFAVAESWMRRMPGRIVGQTVDRAGKRGFVLTLQAREQHIRREKATSNICSNQALLALCASVYLSTMGKQGIQDVGKLNVQKAHYAAKRLTASGKLSLPFAGSFFNEFAVKLPDGANVQELSSKLLQRNIIGGYDLGRDYPELAGHMLIAVTEQRTREEIDAFADALEELV